VSRPDAGDNLNGEILRQRLAALQQLMHTRDQDPLQPLQRLQGILRESMLAELLLLDALFAGEQA
jgi:hypothetical protein